MVAFYNSLLDIVIYASGSDILLYLADAAYNIINEDIML